MLDRGFSLLEALIAAALVAGAIAVLMHLVMRATAQSLNTETATVAATLAQAKLEELRAARFAFDAAGARVQSASLASSSDALGRFGEPDTVETAVAFARRWSVDELAGDEDTLVLTVCVDAVSHRLTVVNPECVWAIRTRQP
jgi:type II secretory pathway pseudopilin PulG